MNTALTELIERLDAQHKVMPVEAYRKGLEYAKAAATELLEKEREQIKNANANGIHDAAACINGEKFNTSEQYYNQTFKQQSEVDYQKMFANCSLPNEKHPEQEEVDEDELAKQICDLSDDQFEYNCEKLSKQFKNKH